MDIFIQKYRKFPLWKFYGDNKMYLGQIIGESKEEMKNLAISLLPILNNEKVEGYNIEHREDKSIKVTEIKFDKMIAIFEKEFASIKKAIEADINK